MLIGYAAARWLDLNRAQGISITLEVGLQNSSLAMVMALGLLGNYEMSLTPAIYTLVMFSSAGVLAYWVGRSRASTGAAAVKHAL